MHVGRKIVDKGKNAERNGTRPKEDVKGKRMVSRTAAEEFGGLCLRGFILLQPSVIALTEYQMCII